MHFPRFTFLLNTKHFALRVGVFAHADAYGMSLAWGHDAASAGFVASTHRNIRHWVWMTAQQVVERG